MCATAVGRGPYADAALEHSLVNLLFFISVFSIIGLAIATGAVNRPIFEALDRKVKERTAELARTNQELKEAKESADAANQAKSDFLAAMSHEIRNPLGAVLGFAELLVMPNQSQVEQQSCIDAIKRNGELLSSLVNDILDLSKVEAGKMVIEKSVVSLDEVIGDIEVQLSRQAEEKGLSLEFIKDSDLPVSIETDALRLRQILLNIVSNALKIYRTRFGSGIR